MKKEMKMWCICRKKDGKPIKVAVDENIIGAEAVGFATKEELIKAAKPINPDEVVKKIIFEY